MPAELVPAPSQERLSPLEIEAIDLFISFLRLLGLPKSIGELYGILFVSPAPLPMDELMARLNMSKGAASQGLKLLRSFGAIRSTYVAGDRRDHYIADFDLSRFATVFIKEELKPRLERSRVRLERMEQHLEQLPSDERDAAAARIAKLRHWQEKGNKMLPWILRFLVR